MCRRGFILILGWGSHFKSLLLLTLPFLCLQFDGVMAALAKEASDSEEVMRYVGKVDVVSKTFSVSVAR
jgi:hypothetical protein